MVFDLVVVVVVDVVDEYAVVVLYFDYWNRLVV